MSRSRKKVSAYTRNNAGTGRWWKRSIHKSLRTQSRLRIIHCEDWDELVMPVIKEVSDVYSSPKDGMYIQFDAPDDVECIRERQKYLFRGMHFWLWEMGKDGHYINKDKCDCITNKKGSYWKGFRK